jgi:hypothetical protein
VRGHDLQGQLHDELYGRSYSKIRLRASEHCDGDLGRLAAVGISTARQIGTVRR